MTTPLQDSPELGGDASVVEAKWLRKLQRILTNSELHETTRVVDAIDTINAALAASPAVPSSVEALRVTDEMVEASCAVYAKATGYYVEFHSGLRSESSDRMRKAMRSVLEAALSRPSVAEGTVALPMNRETLGRMVREAWVRWAMTQPSPKPSWLVPYDELAEPDKEADRQIGEAIAKWTIIHHEAQAALVSHPLPQAGASELVERLKAEEARMLRLWDACEEVRKKHVGTPAAFDINGLKHAVAGRDPVLIEAAATIADLQQRIAVAEAELDNEKERVIFIDAAREAAEAKLAEAVNWSRNADDEDWQRLFAMIDDSGHGRFRKEALSEFRSFRTTIGEPKP
jgi:hypothetical protein